MNILRALVLLASHGIVAAFGFAAGIYALPIIIEPDPPAEQEIGAIAARATYEGEFQRELKDSDALHWGEGTVSIANDAISLEGELAPGPDYKLYLSPEFVETEVDFQRLKSSMVRVGDVKTFDGFIVTVPSNVDVSKFGAVVVWCETFGQFITAAQYR